jgi:hypothetical protein
MEIETSRNGTTPDLIPDPEVVRDRLKNLFAEARALRGLLRISERVKQQQQQTQTMGGRK